MRRRQLWAGLTAAVIAVAGAGWFFAPRAADPPRLLPGRPREAATVPSLEALYDLRRAGDPARTTVHDKSTGQLVAVLTDGARTAVFRGARRTLTERSASATIETDQWVRVAPHRWSPGQVRNREYVAWFRAQLDSDAPDVLQIITEYLRGAPQLRDEKGAVYAGDAGFGIERGDGVDGADFHEYMGIPWTFPNGQTVEASPRWLGSLDCSGFLRMVYGYRSGLRLLTGKTTKTVDGLPRTAHAMAYQAASAVVATGAGTAEAPADLGELQPGDLVFFALRADAGRVSHSGIYLGPDGDGRPRFVSSRSISQGPSFGDYTSRSTLDDPTFRAALRRVIRL